jgi:hypothetical protein
MPGHWKTDFRNHREGDQGAELQADDGDDGNERIL